MAAMEQADCKTVRPESLQNRSQPQVDCRLSSHHKLFFWLKNHHVVNEVSVALLNQNHLCNKFTDLFGEALLPYNGN